LKISILEYIDYYTPDLPSSDLAAATLGWKLGFEVREPLACFLVPLRNGELLRWCLAAGLRITQTMTLMSVGLYNPPEGAWLPSVTY